jgi:hypothetical protein
MIPQTYLELVADGLGLSNAEHEVLPSHTAGRDGSFIHSKIPLQLRMNLPQGDAFSAIRTLHFFALSCPPMRRSHSKPIARRVLRRFSPIHF